MCIESRLRKEGEVTYYKIVIAPSLQSRNGVGGELMRHKAKERGEFMRYRLLP